MGRSCARPGRVDRRGVLSGAGGRPARASPPARALAAHCLEHDPGARRMAEREGTARLDHAAGRDWMLALVLFHV